MAIRSRKTTTKSRRTSRAERRKFAENAQRALRATENQYVAALRGIMSTITRQFVERLTPLLGEIARKDSARSDANTLSNEVDLLGIRVRTALPAAVGAAYGRMSNGVASASDRVIGVTLRDIAGSGAGSARVLADIDAARDRNIRLVEEAARVYAADVRKVVEDPANFGLRVEQIKAKLIARGNVAESRAELIARDQTLKLNGQIAQQRMARAGIGKYTWSTSGDERVRPEHAALEGQVFSWDSPPPVGHPGQDFQCRCVAIPYLEEAEGLFDTPAALAPEQPPAPPARAAAAPATPPGPSTPAPAEPIDLAAALPGEPGKYVVEEHTPTGLVVTNFRTKREAHEAGMAARREGRVAFSFPAASPFRSKESLLAPKTAPPEKPAPKKITIPTRTPAERKEIVRANVEAGMDPDKAQRLDRMFREKSPLLSEIKSAYTAPGLSSDIRVDVSGGQFTIEAQVRDAKTGQAVTRAYDRSIHRNPDGSLTAVHEHFNVAPEYRSGGTGKTLLANSVRFHHELGVREIMTHPAGSRGKNTYEQWKRNQDTIREIGAAFKRGEFDESTMRAKLGDEYQRYTSQDRGSSYVGPHAWASMGFQWPEGEGERIAPLFAQYLQTYHGVPPELAHQIAEDTKMKPRELLEVKVGDKLAGHHFMSEHVEGAAYDWRIKCTKSDAGWQHMKRRLGLEDLKDD